jgi:hypothetical protein
MVSYVFLAGVTTATSIGGGHLAPPSQALDADSHALANVFASVYTDAVGDQFYSLWAANVSSLPGYAKAAASGDVAGESRARSDLDRFRTELGAMVASTTPGLTSDVVAGSMQDPIASLLAAIDAQAAKSPAQFDLLRKAADAMPKVADVLSEAIAEQFLTRFLP